jgi:tRNA(Ile)-lysidine synthase TilS/MesJ
VRPLLHATRKKLRQYLLQRGIAWREDASNESGDYLRNRVRKIMSEPMRDAMIALGSAGAIWKAWVNDLAPVLGESFACAELADLPRPLARAAAVRWLAGKGCPQEDLSSDAAERLIEMASDAATPPRQFFPGNVMIGRRGGRIGAHTLRTHDP